MSPAPKLAGGRIGLMPAPHGRRGNVTAIKDDGGIELTRPIIEKLSLQDLYPPAPGEERDSDKGRWGGSMVMNRHGRQVEMST